MVNDEAAAKLAGTPWGEGLGVRALPDKDPRYYALRALRRYLSLLDFSRTGTTVGMPVAFRVPAASIYTEQPDDVAGLVFPSLSLLAGRGVHASVDFGAGTVYESEIDRYAPGTTVLQQAEYTEQFTLEVWASHEPERRALMAGLKVALRPLQETDALRLKLPAYLDRVAEFTLLGSQYIEEPDIIRGRRRGHMYLELRVPEVQLVDAVTLVPVITLQVVDADDPFCQTTLPYTNRA
jgi:hypothetical protein